MRRAFLSFLILLSAATSALGQVQVDVRLDKPRYLAGEPIVVVVEVRNVGDEAVGYSACEGGVRLAVAAAKRRTRPNIFGCFGGMGSSSGGCAIDHPPLLPPGESTTFTYLLKEYDLAPGQYELTASGKAGVRWKYYPADAPDVPPPRRKHNETDPVPGAQFERTLPLNVVAATERDLRAAFAPLVAAVDGTDAAERHRARAAIVESAAPFLESVIARFAEEDQFETSAIDALGRIASASSRTHLKNLLRTSGERYRSSIVLAVARIGHRDDTDFFVSVLRDDMMDVPSRRYAALGLGRIGGDRAVQHLERALVTASPEARPSIATALGNTGSRAAVPVLIGMFGNNPARNEVCGALRTLTHRAWCDGTADDPAAKRRRWLRSWSANRSKTSIFGPDNCPADPIAVAVLPTSAPKADDPAPSGPPRITSLAPEIAAPNSVVDVTGYALGLQDPDSVAVVFTQGGVEHTAAIGSMGYTHSRDPDSETQDMEVVVPAELTPGRWELLVAVNGRRSIAVPVEIIRAPAIELTGISPARPHPAEGVLLTTKSPAQVGAHLQLTDARGGHWRIASAVSALGMSLTLPDEVADGEASIRVEDENSSQGLSAPLKFQVTSGPLPLTSSAVALMIPVAPGQWTDLVMNDENWFEVRRVDRIDVEFQQGDVVETSRATGTDNVHVHVPGRLKSGAVTVRTRTWIDQDVSEWSVPTPFTLVEERVVPTIFAIHAGALRHIVWWSGESAPPTTQTRPGETLLLRGHFPVADAGELVLQMQRPRATLELRPADVDGGVAVEIPSQASPGDWRLIIRTKDRRTPPTEVTTLRVM